MKQIQIILIVLSFISLNQKVFSQKETTYNATEIIKLDENNSEINLTKKEKSETKLALDKMRFYITEFENQAFLKDSYDSKNPLRLKKLNSFLNTREYTAKEKYLSWKLEITSYPISNKVRIEMKTPMKDSEKMETLIIIGKEI